MIQVKTNSSGIATVRLILGKRTGFGCIGSCPNECESLPEGNPTLWWESTYTYSQQVGENIVDACLASGTGITKPFTAFAFPDKPQRIRKIHGDGAEGIILSFAGFIAVSVEDQYCNPISNLPVDFQVQPATPGPCSDPSQEHKQAVLIKKEDTCMDTVPIYGDCNSATFSMTETTSSKGASVYMIFGDMPDTVYPVTATCTLPDANSLTETFPFTPTPSGTAMGNHRLKKGSACTLNTCRWHYAIYCSSFIKCLISSSFVLKCLCRDRSRMDSTRL